MKLKAFADLATKDSSDKIYLRGRMGAFIFITRIISCIQDCGLDMGLRPLFWKPDVECPLMDTQTI